jgi:hypothetical protein
MHTSRICFLLCQCYNFYRSNIWSIGEQRCIWYICH